MVKVQTCGCIVRCGGLYLFVHQVASDYWGFPKGGIHHGETEQECAIRELLEETGISIGTVQLGESIHWNKTRFYVVDLHFRPPINVDKQEIDDYKWGSLNDIEHASTSRLTRVVITRLRDAPTSPPHKSSRLIKPSWTAGVKT